MLGCSCTNQAAKPAPTADDGPAAAKATVARWMESIKKGDMDAASKCLCEQARAEGAFAGGAEAARFWGEELRQLEAKGFEGEWEHEKTGMQGREVIYLFPVVGPESSAEAVWLIREEGEWRIANLFTRPRER